MAISTNLKPLIYRNLYDNTVPGLKNEFASDNIIYCDLWLQDDMKPESENTLDKCRSIITGHGVIVEAKNKGFTPKALDSTIFYPLEAVARGYDPQLQVG